MATARTTSSGIVGLLKQDPKKAIVLTVLVGVLGVMWARMALSGKTSPQSASAMMVAQSVPPKLPSSNNSGKTADNTGLLREWINEPLPYSVTRNMFEVKLDYYPMDATHKKEDLRTIDDPTFWEKLAKSIDAQAEEQHKKENLIQNLRQQAGQLQVTSTLMGPRPKAMINGAMVGEGESVAQFRVSKIEARAVVVEREGITLRIPMK